jgi:hypothetical protein
MTSLFQKISTLLAAALLTSGCASVSVDNVAKTQRGPNQKPDHIYVVPFSVANTRVKENFARGRKGELKSEAQRLLHKELVAEISKNLVPASTLRPGAVPRGNVWIVQGEITRIEEGSRVLRMGVGLGLGGTKLETAVAVSSQSPANPPFLQFTTTGGSNATPGAATNPIPFSAAPTALIRAGDGTTDDAGRTARMITAAIGEQMIKRGWLPPGSVPPPKIKSR